MSIRKLFANSPIFTAVGIVLVTALITVGVGKSTGIFVSADMDNLARDVARLKAESASIKRHAAGSGDVYFDVTKLFVSKERGTALGKQYISAHQGAFYFVPPTGSEWNYGMVSEGELAGARFDPHSATGLDTMHGSAADEKNIHLWRGKTSIGVTPNVKEDLAGLLPPKLVFAPMISVQVLDQGALTNMSVAIAGMLDSAHPDDRASKAAMQQSALQVQQLMAAIDKETAASSPQTAAPEASARQRHDNPQAGAAWSADDKVRMEKILGQLYRGDMSVIMLQGLMMGAMQLPITLSDTQIALNDIERKGNVLYAQLSISLHSVKVDGQDKKVNLVIDKEVFFVATPARMVLIQIEVPTIGAHASASPWITGWLDSVRIGI